MSMSTTAEASFESSGSALQLVCLMPPSKPGLSSTVRPYPKDCVPVNRVSHYRLRKPTPSGGWAS